MIIDKVENESKLNDGLSLVYFFSAGFFVLYLSILSAAHSYQQPL